MNQLVIFSDQCFQTLKITNTSTLCKSKTKGTSCHASTYINLSRENYTRKVSVHWWRQINTKNKSKCSKIKIDNHHSLKTNYRPWSFVVVHVFDELDRWTELYPPVLLLSPDPVTIETLYVLNGGQQTGRVCLDDHKDDNRDKIVSSGHRFLVGHTEEVHDGGGTAEHTLDLVLGGL